MAASARTRQLISINSTAARLWLSSEDYKSRLDAGELWCVGCKTFHPATSFGRSRARPSGKHSCCLEFMTGVRRANREGRKVYDRDRYRARLARKPPNRTLVPIDAISGPDIAYLAGLIDGEGCFTIAIVDPKGKRHHQPLLGITMTHRGVIDWVAALIGMPEATEIRKPRKPEHATQYRVQLTGKRAIRLGERCLPHLKVKRDHVEVLLKFRETYLEQGGPGVRVGPHVRARRDSLRGELKRLNARGPRHQEVDIL